MLFIHIQCFHPHCVVESLRRLLSTCFLLTVIGGLLYEIYKHYLELLFLKISNSPIVLHLILCSYRCRTRIEIRVYLFFILWAALNSLFHEVQLETHHLLISTTQGETDLQDLYLTYTR